MGLINDSDNPTFRRLSAGVMEQDQALPGADKPSAGELWGAAWRTENVIGSMSAREADLGENDIDPDFNPITDDNLAGYERYEEKFYNVYNERQNSALKRQIDRESADRETIARGGLAGFGFAMAAGTLDPTVLVPVGGNIKKGESLLRIGRKMAYAGAAGASVSEIALHASQQTRTVEESGYAIAGGAVLGGILGTGAVAGFRRATGKPISGFDPDEIAKFEREMTFDPDGDLNEPDAAVLARIESEISVASLLPQDVQKAEARALASMMTTMARREGRDPAEFYEQEGVRLSAKERYGVGAIEPDEVDEIAEAIGADVWDGPRPTRPGSLIEWIRAQGGIRDQNGLYEGDLRQILGGDVRNRPGMLNNQNGSGIDELTRRANEEGFDIAPEDYDGFMRAIESEIAGEPSFRIGEGDDWLAYQEFKSKQANQVLEQASGSGYKGSNAGEAAEWLSASRKGLEMSQEARMARAQEMGFDTEAVSYRGINGGYDPSKAGNYQMFTQSPEDAGEFGNTVIPAYLKKGKNLQLDGGGNNFNSIPVSQLPDDVQANLHPRTGNFARTDEIAYAAQKAGYDSVSIGNVYDNANGEIPLKPQPVSRAEVDDLLSELEAAGFDMSAEGTMEVRPEIPRNYDPTTVDVIFDPSNIRSVNAAFDPDLSGSANLLAQSPPRSLREAMNIDPQQRSEWYDRVIDGKEIDSSGRPTVLEIKADTINMIHDDVKIFFNGPVVDFTAKGLHFRQSNKKPTMEEVRTAARVMSHVSAVLQEYVKRYDVPFLEFSGATPAHARLYRSMLEKFKADGYQAYEAQQYSATMTRSGSEKDVTSYPDPDNPGEVTQAVEGKQDFVIVKDGYEQAASTFTNADFSGQPDIRTNRVPASDSTFVTKGQTVTRPLGVDNGRSPDAGNGGVRETGAGGVQRELTPIEPAQRELFQSSLDRIAAGRYKGRVVTGWNDHESVLAELDEMFETSLPRGEVELGFVGSDGRFVSRTDQGLLLDLLSNGQLVPQAESLARRAIQSGEEFAITAEMITEPRELLQRQGEGPRGQFNPDTGIITLFDNADPSTLMHEASHWYLDRLFKMSGNQFVDKQLDDILKWHGTKADEVFDDAGNLTDRGVDLQEAFAETFEQYLKAGKAPVPGLQAIFDQFREWLTAIYKTLSPGERANLTPEIKEVFDRMLAFEPDGMEKLNLEAMRNPQSVGAAAVAEPELADYELANSLGSADVSAALRLNPLLRMATADSPVVREIGAQLMENGMYLKRNLDGKASPVSVEQAMTEYRGWHAKAETGAVSAYKANRKDASTPTIGEAEFYERVALAMRRGDQDANPHVVKAAQAYRVALDKVRDRAIAEGLLPEDVKVTTAESYLHRMWNRNALTRRSTEFKAMTRAWLGDTFDGMIARANQLRFELDRVGAKPNDADAIFLEQVSELEEILATEGGLGDFTKTVADDIFDALMGHDTRLVDTGFSLVPNARGPLKERTFSIPDLFEAQGVKVEDFLVNDAQEVMSRYMRVMAADIELARAFGSPDLAEPIARIREDYRAMSDSAKTAAERKRLNDQMRNRIDDLNGVRDVIRGNYGENRVSGAGAVWARGAELVRAWNFMTMLGGMTVSALPDVGNKVMSNGFYGIARDMIGPLLTDIKGVKGAAQEAKELGIAVEMALATRIASIADVGDMYGRGTKFERFANNLSNRFSNWTLMRHWNDIMKTGDYIAATNRAIRVMERPGRSNKKAKAWLASLGIGDADYQRIMAQIKEHGDKRHTMRLANVEKWTDEEARRIWIGAMGKNANIQTVTPGAGDKLLVMNGDLGKTLGQFKSFALAANQRIMIRGAQQARMGDARFLSGMMTFISLGMLVYVLKSYFSNRDTSDDPVTWVREGVDRSGTIPVFMEVFNTAEKVTGQSFIGESPSSRFASRGRVDSLAGPTFGRMQNVSDVLSNAFDGELKDRDLHSVRKILPFNNVFWLRKLFDEFEIQAVEATDAEETSLSERRESMFTN